MSLWFPRPLALSALSATQRVSSIGTVLRGELVSLSALLVIMITIVYVWDLADGVEVLCDLRGGGLVWGSDRFSY